MEKIGEILKKEREGRKLSVKQVCEDTKIRERVINAIESDDYSIMPEVYLLSFVKAYAKFLGIKFNDGFEKTLEIKKVELHNGAIPKKEHKHNIVEDTTETIKKSLDFGHHIFSQKRLKKINNQYLVKILVYSALIIAIVALLVLAFYPQDSQQNETKNQKNSSEQSKQPSSGLLSSFTSSSIGDSIKLEAFASDTSWVYIDIDGKYRKEALLTPKGKIEWHAAEFFVLTIGNAGAVKIVRDGTELQQFGGFGKVARNIKITRNEVITPQKQFDDKNTEKK